MRVPAKQKRRLDLYNDYTSVKGYLWIWSVSQIQADHD